MKTKLLLSLLLSFYFCLLSSQVPQGFNYQAIARDGSGNPITGTSMQVKIGILSDTIANIMVWEELFNPVKTNAFGMFTIIVGTGVKQSGSATTFSAIDWTKTPLFLRTSIYYPSSWKVMGTSKLQSVPYSMVAANIEGTVPQLSVKGNTATMDSALFVVRNNTGQIVFAVYNEGVRIFVDDGKAKGATKGGFAIGSFDRSKGTSQTLFVVDPDSIRAYIDTGLVKSRKGGFAIGSFDRSKAGNQQYFQVTNDSIRMYINDSPSKAVKGGFAVGGFDKSKGAGTNYLRVSSDSIRLYTVDTLGHAGFQIKNIKSLAGSAYVNISGSTNISIGDQTGMDNTSGFGNTFIGHQSGLNNTSGSANVYLGYEAGKGNVSGVSNVYLGYMCGLNNSWGKGNICMGANADQNGTGGDFNLILGTAAGFNNIGNGNIFLGFEGGYGNTTGSQNICIGTVCGAAANSTSSENVFIGRYVNASYPAGNGNVVIGSYAGQAMSNNAAYNVIIGWAAGQLNQGNKNVFLGYSAGLNETGSNKLYIDNSNTSSPLIWGDFSARVLNFNGNVGINTNNPQATLQIINPSANTIMYVGGTQTGQTSLSVGNSAITSGYCYLQSIKAQGSTWGDLILNSSGGNIGIATTTPINKLQIGTITLGSSTATPSSISLASDVGNNAIGNNFKLLLYQDLTSTKYGFGLSSGLLEIVAGNSGSIAFFTNGANDRMRILSNGNVGIGTATPGYKLQVGNAADGSQARANAWNLLSDIRYKTGFEYLHDALGKISLLKGFYFYWNTGTDKSRQFGLSAQDVEKVLPEVVSSGTDGYLSVDYGKLVPLLIEGMKDQQQQIESYKSEIQSLREKVEQIDSQQKEIDELKTRLNTLVSNQGGQGNK